MTSWKKAVSLTVITACIFAVPTGVMAKETKLQGQKEKVEKEITIKVEKKEKQEEKQLQTKEKDKAWQEAKDVLEVKKDKVEGQKDLLEAQKDIWKADYETAIESGNLELAQELLDKMNVAKGELEALKLQMKDIKIEMKEIIKNKYTQEELDALKEVAEEIQEEDADVTVIPVENIFSKNGKFKFDVPPVIKQGRTLIPVRAITEGFGAAVAWDGEAQKVTITKGHVEIIFQLADGKVWVNGEEKTIDVPASLISNRTVVPLRFIVENLGLKVDYDEETGIIEIEDEEETGTQTEGIEEKNTQEEPVVIVEPQQPITEDPVVVVEPVTREE